MYTSFYVADISLCYDENDELSSLRSNLNQARGYDGDNPIEPLKAYPQNLHKRETIKEIQEVHALVRNSLD